MLWPQPPEPKFCGPGGLLSRRSQSSGCPHSPEKGQKHSICFSHRHDGPCTGGSQHGHQQTEPRDKQQGRRLQASEHRRPGSPSGRTPWTSCPVTWLFGVETGGKPRRLGEELRWGGPVAESSPVSTSQSPRPLEPQEGGLQGRVTGKERGSAVWCLSTSAPADRTCVETGPMPRLLVLSLPLPAGA